MIDMSYPKIIEANRALNEMGGPAYPIKILSNISINQAQAIGEYSLRSKGINSSINLGDYDNILQDSLIADDCKAVIVIWELCNLVDGLDYTYQTVSDQFIANLLERVVAEMRQTLANLASKPLVIVNKFSDLLFRPLLQPESNLSILRDNLNAELESIQNELSNVRVVDIDHVISMISIEKSKDNRLFRAYKCLYSIDFYKHYFEYIRPLITSSVGQTKKVLVLDCDNTLWKGIIGEDGMEGIEIFSEIQHTVVGLANRGIIVCLCSKNNPADVNEVLEKCEDMVLKNEHIVLKKINWEPKYINLEAIAKELNVGIDSLIFVDDSDYEVNLARTEVPSVEVIQVDPNYDSYKAQFKSIEHLFYNPNVTEEDLKKVTLYQQQIDRSALMKQSGDIEPFLRSLGLEIEILVDDESQVPRMSQMTQKTNQFNMTTKRYTEGEIANFVASHHQSTVAVRLKDKFGDYGLIGLVIVNHLGKTAEIDTFLMSCRALGRMVEYQMVDTVVDLSKKVGAQRINATYVPTAKNGQVKDLFENFGANQINESKGIKSYSIDIASYTPNKKDYIDVRHRS